MERGEDRGEETSLGKDIGDFKKGEFFLNFS